MLEHLKRDLKNEVIFVPLHLTRLKMGHHAWLDFLILILWVLDKIDRFAKKSWPVISKWSRVVLFQWEPLTDEITGFLEGFEFKN